MISPHYEGHSHVMVEDRDRQTLQCQQCNGFSFAARCTTVSGNALTRYTARGLAFRPVSLCCLACYCPHGCRSYTWVGGGGHNGLKSILRAHSFFCVLAWLLMIYQWSIHSFKIELIQGSQCIIKSVLLQKIVQPIVTLPVGDHAKAAEKQVRLILTTAY